MYYRNNRSLNVLLIIASLFFTHVAQANWETTLGDLWQSTKSKAGELTDVVKERFNPKEPVNIGIAYGTEKRKWLEWAVSEFAKTEAGKNININLIPKGSVEGAKAILNQDAAAKKIHVWTPASSVVENLLAEPWENEHGTTPIASDAPLALTPMVFVMWKDRYEAFISNYPELSFTTISQALNEDTGWQAIADKATWGVFTFGHTLPTHSNSGLLSLVLMAYDYHQIVRGLTAEKIMEPTFLEWLHNTQKYMTADEKSTGTLMRKMLRFGPSELNGVVVYENLALSNLDIAKGRWGELQIVYPKRTIWNDNPYYILDVPWSTQEQKDAAHFFQAFLLGEKAQKKARDEYLFRPASLDIPILEEGSAFNKLKDMVQIDIATIRRPNADVLQQLISVWKRNN